MGEDYLWIVNDLVKVVDGVQIVMVMWGLCVWFMIVVDDYCLWVVIE